MAVYFSDAPSLGALTGQSLGTGVGGALQQLTNMKLHQVQQQKTAQGLQSLGFNPQESSALANLDPQTLQQVVKQKLASPGNQAYLEALQGILGGPQQQGQLPQVGQQGEAPQVQGITQKSSGISSILGKPGINQQQATKLAELGLKQQEIGRKEKETLRKEDIKKQFEINKETRPVVEKINKEAKSAKANDMRLNRIEKLNEEGNLGIPIFNSAIKTISNGVFGFGLDLKGLMTKDAQELEKLSTDFVKEAKDIFGSRLTDTDLKTFLQTVPNLYMSKDGRSSLIRNMRAFNEAAKLRQKALNEVIKENNGQRPANIEELIDEKISPELDKISQQFTLGASAKPAEEPGILKRIGQGVGLAY